MTKEYKNMVQSIAQIEKSQPIESAQTASSSIAENYIDLSSIEMNVIALDNSKKYQRLLTIINNVEKKIHPQRPPADLVTSTETNFQPYKQQLQAVEQQTSTEQVQRQTPPQKSNYNQNVTPSNMPTSNIKQDIAKELNDITNQISSAAKSQTTSSQEESEKLKEVSISKRSNKDLVLPNLSLSDQITELEKIIEGINENVFDDEHMAIISKEAKGLEEIIRSERKKADLSQADPTEALRDLRISTVLAILKERGYD